MGADGRVNAGVGNRGEFVDGGLATVFVERAVDFNHEAGRSEVEAKVGEWVARLGPTSGSEKRGHNGHLVQS